MNYSKADGLYASPKYLDYLSENLIKPCIEGKTKSLISFRGAGHRSLLLFLIRNWKILNPKYSNHIFTWIDFNLASSPSEMFASSLSDILQNYSNSLPNEIKTEIEETLLKKTTLIQYEQILYKLTHTHKHQVTIIFNSFSEIYHPEYDSTLIDYIQHLLHIYPQSINTLALLNVEYTLEDLTQLEEINSLITTSQVYGKDIVFESDSAQIALNNYQKKYSKELTKKQKDKLFEIVGTDPTALKYVLEKVYTDNFDLFAEDIYIELDSNWLDGRYMSIWNSLTKESQHSILTNNPNNSKFVKDSGIFTEGYINPLFKEFIKRIKKEQKQDEIHIRKYLTAKEVLIYNLLEKNLNNVVHKDYVSAQMWGDDWVEKFSDYALTKTISRLRAKLNKYNIQKEIKAVRGEGVILSDL